MRHAKADRFGHGGMREQNFVDFTRRDLLAATDDQFLEAAGQMEIAIFVENALIARAEPIAEEGSGGGFRVVFVFAYDAGAVDTDLAGLACLAAPTRSPRGY